MEYVMLASVVLQLMAAAEKLIPSGTGGGPIKKSIVTGIVQALVDAVGGISTGGQKQTFAALAPLISTLIDVAAPFINLIAGKVVVDVTSISAPVKN